jgi:hypothetical protein
MRQALREVIPFADAMDVVPISIMAPCTLQAVLQPAVLNGSFRFARDDRVCASKPPSRREGRDKDGAPSHTSVRLDRSVDHRGEFFISGLQFPVDVGCICLFAQSDVRFAEIVQADVVGSQLVGLLQGGGGVGELVGVIVNYA